MRTITSSFVRPSIADSPSTPMNGIAIVERSGTWASDATIGLVASPR
jgi:hypothetical protein